MNYYAKTDIGKVRNKNQDQAAVNANIKDQVIAVVCDGMGVILFHRLIHPKS